MRIDDPLYLSCQQTAAADALTRAAEFKRQTYLDLQLVQSEIRIQGMELHALGFNDWFQRKLGEIDKPGYSLARITVVNRDNYRLRNETSEVLTELTGRLMFPAESSIDLPAVGDWVFAPFLSNIFTSSLQM